MRLMDPHNTKARVKNVVSDCPCHNDCKFENVVAVFCHFRNNDPLRNHWTLNKKEPLFGTEELDHTVNQDHMVANHVASTAEDDTVADNVMEDNVVVGNTLESEWMQNQKEETLNDWKLHTAICDRSVLEE